MKNDPLKQKQRLMPDLRQSASLSDVRSEGTAKGSAENTGKAKNTVVPAQVGHWVSFFFDGTGNNMEADVRNDKHSNVARLFRLHQDNPAQGIFRYYLPGIGTLFRAINDTGGKMAAGTGGKGEERLDWAMNLLEERFAKSKGALLNVSLFGFSRGAALARAFAVRIAERSERGKDGVWRFSHKGTGYPIRICFMGLFDTVASVGVAMAANNEPARGLTVGLFGLETAMKNRSGFSNALENIAFGDAPGADPAAGMANGHMAWGDDLHIPEMVVDCLHLVAAHEIRNSFPLDSVLQGLRYPKNCREIVFPGAHSDVGGGYRKGEGARSPSSGSLLSLIPLWEMRTQALKAGVPLLKTIDSEVQKMDFGEDPASKSSFETLKRRYIHYMKVAGWGGKPLGSMMLSHMKLYYQWRFFEIARDQKARAAKLPTKDAAFMKDFEPRWEQERVKLEARTKKLKGETDAHMANALALSRSAVIPSVSEKARNEVTLARQKREEFLTAQSLLDAQPNSDGSFVRNSDLYDAQLLADARTLQAAVKKGRTNLRPHYRALLDAYEAEQRGQGLRDPEIIAFFDTYVHDSLAGFGGDATLPSDPRVLYIGGDEKLRYAMNKPGGMNFPASMTS
ncbi:T6SS phospholipase effector Tle1-like catalytic domain-containing protein [Archangium lipolyticum]|uniref:T6SS phospholipase effector Tle1-like catalytic domain-containing protein n=1 Tax=Archangium lipolyticum TaxID=2970465 RepID=UPI00214A45E0|nr:DUF2235 domain-containing protein [Archangium lipolyticum]